MLLMIAMMLILTSITMKKKNKIPMSTSYSTISRFIVTNHDNIVMVIMIDNNDHKLGKLTNWVKMREKGQQSAKILTHLVTYRGKKRKMSVFTVRR